MISAHTWRMNRQLGFNIFELMITVAVLGVLMGVGVPAMQSLMQNSRLTTQINLLSTTLALARSEAIKVNQRVLVCLSTSGTDCEAAGSGKGWDEGWMVFVDRNSDSDVDLGPPGTDDCAVNSTTDCILATQAGFLGTNTLTPATDAPDFLAYVGDGSLRCNTDANVATLETCNNANTFYTLCDFRGAGYAKGLSISRTGRVASVDKQPNGSAFSCP